VTRIATNVLRSVRREPAFRSIWLATILVAGVVIPTAEQRSRDLPDWLSVAVVGGGIGLALAVRTGLARRRADASSASILRDLSLTAITAAALAIGVAVLMSRLFS
jgi:hypothetical protein